MFLLPYTHLCLAWLVGFFLCHPFIAAQCSFLHPSGSLTFPVYHKSHGQTQTRHGTLPLNSPASGDVDVLNSPELAADLSPAPSSCNVPALRDKVETLSATSGQFFAELQIGSPPMPIAVIIDTGSPLLWIQCKPCIECGPQASGYPIFDPAKSSSYTNVTCHAEACSKLTDNVGIASDCTDTGPCKYNTSYLDKSYSYGILSTDTLIFTTANDSSKESASSPFEFSTFVFGCGVDNVGVETLVNASGLMGLDKGSLSVISQLNVDVFSYCLPNRENNVDVTGYLTFGRSDANASMSSSHPTLQYTPLLLNDYTQFYFLGLTGISINGKLLDIPVAALKLDTQTGKGGTVIDSGTTFTRFVDEVYIVIKKAFASYVDSSLEKREFENRKTEYLCYVVPLSKQGEAPIAPRVTLHFEGSVEMDLSTENLFYLYDSDTANNYYCLAMENSGSLESGAINIIGNFQQQNFLIEYDIGNSRLGFAPTQCSSNSASSPHATTIIGKPILRHLTLIVACILISL